MTLAGHRPALCFAGALAACTVVGCGEDPTLGAVCTDGCGEFDCLDHPSFPGGLCTLTCGSCPPGSECANGYGPPVCLPSCARSDECEREFQCFRGVCRPPCASPTECGESGSRCVNGACAPPACLDDAGCPPGNTCRFGVCSIATPTAALPVGSPCSRASDCEGFLCLDAARGGVCGLQCDARADCDPSEVCAPVPLDLDGDGGFDAAPGACIPGNDALGFVGSLCADEIDCETRTCIDGLCAPACAADAQCLAGQVCADALVVDAAIARVCRFDPLDGIARTDRVELGTVTALGGAAGSRALAVPSDAVSVTLLGRAEAIDQFIGFERVEDVTGTIYDVTDLLLWNDQPVRWLPQDTFEHIQIALPSSTPDRIRLAPGRLSVSLFSIDQPVPVELTALVKRSPNTDVTRGRLDLNVFLVDIGLDQATAVTDVALQTALAQLATIYGSIGIDLGNINYIVPASGEIAELSIVDSTVGPDSEIARLFRLSAGRNELAINVFLVRAIVESIDGSVALGISGGIPGPPGIHGTGHSGVVIGVDPSVVGTGSSAGSIIGQVMAHEIGHYLGLFHTRERDAPCATGVGPTPAAPCAPFGGEDVITDTSRDDGANLMWYALGGADGRTFNTNITAGQAFVLRRSAVVQP